MTPLADLVAERINEGPVQFVGNGGVTQRALMVISAFYNGFMLPQSHLPYLPYHR